MRFPVPLIYLQFFYISILSFKVIKPIMASCIENSLSPHHSSREGIQKNGIKTEKIENFIETDCIQLKCNQGAQKSPKLKSSLKKINRDDQDSTPLQTQPKKLKQKLKKLMIDQSQAEKENHNTPNLIHKVSSNACLVVNQSLNDRQTKKLKRMPSCDKNVQPERLEETRHTIIRKVQFEEVKSSRTDASRQETANQEQRQFRFDEFYRKLTLLKIKEESEPKQTFIQFICGLLRFKKKKVHNKLELKLLNLNRMKVAGSKQQTMMLMQIFEKLISEKTEIEGKSWQKLGFASQKPLNELENIGVLTLLQWWCFVCSNQQKSLKIANSCIELSCSLFNFHRLATKLFCEQLQKFKLKGSEWYQYQEYYNSVVIMAIDQIHKQCSQSIENIEQFMINALAKSVKKIEEARQTTVKKAGSPQPT